jgi:hypothetical protein
MPLTVLAVAYSLAAVGPDAAGGAEQILSTLDFALTSAGGRSIVVAPEGSIAAGVLVPTIRVDGPIEESLRDRARQATIEGIARALDRWPIDLVHMHGLDFDAVLPPAGVPVLATLHLPPAWYRPGALTPSRRATWMHGVSHAQHRALPTGPHVLPPILNGVSAQRARADVVPMRARTHAMFLGRICPEKGVHLAIDASRAAGVPLLVAGAVFGYAAHEQYFEAMVRPRLGAGVTFVGRLRRDEKHRALASARCLLLPSLAPETSSLVAMEALACGTPVIAFRSGALPEIVEDGVTGYLVAAVDEMVEAVARVTTIDPEACCRAVRERFSADRMVGDYLAAYRRVAAGDSVASGG